MRRWFVLVLVLAVACSRAEPERPSGAPVITNSTAPPAAPSVSGSALGPASSELEPLRADWLERLESEGHELYVAPPVGARSPRPVIVAVHGAGDRPDWACGGWRLGSAAFAFVVCPQGLPMGGKTYGWASSRDILERVDRALRAVRERYGAHVARGPGVYAGFSQGANLAAEVLLARAAAFPTALLAEGGYQTTVDSAWARRYRAAGGERLLLVCGNAYCFEHARRARRLLERAGLRIAVAGDPRSGHNLNEPMQRALRAAWPDFFAGVAGWEQYQAAAEP